MDEEDMTSVCKVIGEKVRATPGSGKGEGGSGSILERNIRHYPESCSVTTSRCRMRSSATTCSGADMTSKALLDRPDLEFSCWLQSGQGQTIVAAALEQRAAYEALSPRDLAVFRHALWGASGHLVAREAQIGEAFGDCGSRWTVTCGAVADSDRVGVEGELSRIVFEQVQASSFWRERFRVAEAHVDRHGTGNEVPTPVHVRAIEDFLTDVRKACHDLETARDAEQRHRVATRWVHQLTRRFFEGSGSEAKSPAP